MHSSACSGSACRPVVPALLGLLLLLGPWAGNAHAQVQVPYNWSAKPAGLQDGAKFRLIFLTTTLRDHDSTNVASYDGTVQSDVNGNADLRSYVNQFKALVSTSTVNAIDHVGMTGAGTRISIWWVGGKKVADSYTDFWDGTWDNEALSDLKDEHGNYVNLPTDRRPWTGTTQGGMKATTAHLGAANFGPAVIGNPGRNPGGPIDGASENNRGDMRRLYGVSPVFQVTPQPAVFFTRDNTVVWENAGTVAVTVRLRDISTTATTVRISATGNTASSGTAKGVPAEADFLGFTDEAMIIPAGQRTATKTITIFDDLLYENGNWPEGEEFTVNVVSMNGDTSLGGAETTVTIADDEYTFCFDSKTYLKKESDGVISLPLRISRPLPFTVTATADPIVDYITTQGVDYEVVKGTHTYRPGQSLDGDFQIRIINDRDDEANELFRVTATVPVVPDGEVFCSTDVIIQDDDFKTISVRFEMPNGAVINEGESFTVKVSSPDRPKRAYPIRFYLIDESRVYIDQSRLLRTALLPARANPSVTVDIPTIKSDKPPASNTIRILALGHDRKPTGEQPYAVTSGKMATVTVNEVDDASASFVTLDIPDNTVDEGGVLKINVSAWSIVNDPAFCRKYWDGHYTSEHTTCFVEGTNKALSVDVEVTGDSRLPLIDGEFQEKHRYTVEIPRSGFNNRFTRQTLKLNLRNDAVVNTSGGTISAKAEHGEGYTLVTSHPVFGTEDSIDVVDDEKSTPPVNPVKVRITGFNSVTEAFSDDPVLYEDQAFYVCVNLSRPLDDPDGDTVEFKLTATTEGSPGARFFAEYLGNNGLGGSPKELAGGGTITVDPQRRGTRNCGLITARQPTTNRDPEHVVHLDLDTTQLPPGFLVEKPRATFTIRDRQTHPVTWNLTHDGPAPLSIKEDGATGDFTFRLSEPLDVGEVYDLILFDDETTPQYTLSLAPNSPAGSALLTKEQSGVEFPSRRGLGKVVRFKGAGAQTAIVRVTGVHDEELTAPNPLFDSDQPESATNPERVHASLAGTHVHPGYATGRPYTDGSQPVWHVASGLTHGDIKQNFNIINVDAVTVDADIGWTQEHFNVPEHNGPAQPVIKLSRSLPHDVTVNVRHNSIGSTEGDDWHVSNLVNAADRYLGMIVIPAGARTARYDIIIVKNDNIAEGPEAIGIEIESVTPNTNIKAKADRTFVQRSTVHIFDHQATDRPLSLTCPASVTPNGENEVTLQCTMTLQDPVASNRELSLKAKALLGSSVNKTVNLVFSSGETTKSFSFSIPYHAANFGKSITVNLFEAALHDTSTDPKSRIHGQEADVYIDAINGRWVKTRYFGGTSILKVKDVSTREGGQAELRAVIDPWPKGVESIKLLYSTRYHELDENNRVPEGYAGPDEFHHYVDEPVTCTENGCSFSVFTKTDSDINEKREKFYVDVKADPSVPVHVRETIDTVTAVVNIEGSDVEDVRYNTMTADGSYPARIREDGGTGDFVIQISRPLDANEVYELHFTPERPQYVYSLAPDNPKGVSLESAPDEASCRGRPMGKILRFEGKGTQRAVVRVTGIRTDHKISNPLFDSKKPESATDNPRRIHGSLAQVLVPCYATPVPYLKNLGPPDGYLKHGAHHAYGTTKHTFVIVDVDNTSSLDIGWSQDRYAVNENNGPAQPVLVLSRPLVQETRVRIVHAEGTALQGTGAGKDWHVTPGWRVDGSNDPYLAEFIVPAGVTRVSYDVRMVDDTIAENDETFTATISTVSPTPEHGLAAASDRKLAQTATVKILDNEKWTSEITCTNEYVLGTRVAHNNELISALTGNECKLSLSNPVPANHTLQVVFKAEIGSGEHYKTVNSPLLPVTPSTSTGLSEIALVKNFSFRDYDRIHESLLGEDIRISIESATLTDTSTAPNRVFKLGNTIYQLDHTLARIRLLEEEPAPVPTEQLLSAENVEVREGAVAELRAVIDPWPEDVSGETGIPLIYSTRYAEMDREGNLPPGKAGPRDFYAHWNTPIDCVAVEGGAKGCVIRLHTIQDSHDEGREEFYIDVEADPSVPETLRNLLGRVTATITIVNDDPIPAAWLGRFGRTVAEQALDGISNRIAAPRNAGMQVTLAGQGMNTESNTESNTDTSFNDRTQPELQSQSVTAKDLLLNSSFTLTGKEDALGGNVAFWGRAMHSSFDGKEGTLSLDGEVTTTMLGADYARDKWLLGLSLMQSSAKGGYRDEIDTNGNAPSTDDMAGKVEASLTAAVPYASLQASERLRLWGALGHGAGEIGLKTGIDEAIEADISWTMATMGIRGDVLVPLDEGLGPALALTSDAMWAQTLSDKARGIESSESDVTRFRLGLEGSYNIALAGDGRLTPKLESGVRHDGGDAETGFGVEIGGGIAWVDPALGLSLDVSGRTLLAHGNDDLKDRGYAASLAFDPDPSTKRGASFGLHQEFGGQANGGLDALFQPATLDKRQGSEANFRWNMEAAYGFPAFAGRFTGSPHAGIGLATGARDYTLGWRLTPEASSARNLSFDLRAVRRESDAAEPEHTVGFEFRALW